MSRTYLTLTVALLLSVAYLFSASNAATLPPVIASAVLLGNITDPAHPTLSHDGGYSGFISGYSVWLFDDTMGSGFHSNYAAYGDVLNPLYLNGSVGTEALPFSDAESKFNTYWCQTSPKTCGSHRYAIWPNSSPVQIGNNTGAVFAGRAYINGSAKNKIAGAGTAAYKVTVGEGMYPNFTRMGADTWWNKTQPDFGAYATLDIGDGFVYLYAYDTPYMFLARVVAADVFDKSQYQYYQKGFWIPTAPKRNDSSYSIMYDWVGTSTIFWNNYYQTYAMVFCDWNNLVNFRTAPQPWGPWVKTTVLFNATAGPGGYSYSCAAHPEYSRADNELYISFTYQGKGAYQNRVVKITFE